MDMKKFVPAVVVTFVLYAVLMYIVHQVLLIEDYKALGGIFRDPMPWVPILIGELIFAIGFVYIYAKGVEVKPWLGQAVTYGVLVWLLVGLSAAFVAYAVYPFDLMLVVKQAVLGLIALIILALPVAYIYRR